MGIKICLDAGHYGSYNRSPAVKTYYESDMAWKLHMFLKEKLEEYGFEVITTRATQAKDLDIVKRGKLAKGCDLFLSIHSNATGSGKNESIDYPIVYSPVNGKGAELAKQLANTIADVMGTKQKGRAATRSMSNGNDYYGVIRGAVSVGVVGLILEHSFHTNTKATNWLMLNSNLEKLAAAEAKVIADYYGNKKQMSGNVTESSNGYKVRIIADVLNVRKGAGTGYKIVTTVKKNEVYTVVEEKNGWGKLKSGAGWISLSYTKRV